MHTTIIIDLIDEQFRYRRRETANPEKLTPVPSG